MRDETHTYLASTKDLRQLVWDQFFQLNPHR